ncbi:unnamed protein product [Heterobilharzia americana]|nr:unnamed protein product [Heterobilharzia americana]
MSPLGPRKVRRHNRTALSEIPGSSKSKCSSNAENKSPVSGKEVRPSDFNESWARLGRPLITGQEAQSIVSNLKSQNDVFSLYYRPSSQKSKIHSTSYSHKNLTSYSNNEILHSSPKRRESHFSCNTALTAKRDSINKSGRISQLASRVEHLLIQDHTNTFHCETVSQTACHSVGCESSSFPLEFSDDSSSSSIKRKTNLSISSPTKTTLSSPWYRHCRPKAPPPVLSLPVKSGDVNSFENQCYDSRICKSGSSSGDDHQVVECEKLFKPIPCHLSSLPSHSTHSLTVASSEVDGSVSQENIFCHPDLPPPPPLLPASSDVDLALMNRSYSLPSPPVESIYEEPNIFSDEIPLKPLASITNILPNGGVFIRRHPKWANDCNPDVLRSHAVLRYSGLDSNFDSDFNLSPSIPSPPPLIVERLPCGMNILESQDQQILHPSALNNPSLARPTFLKRGAPDGAEQHIEDVANSFEHKTIPVTEDCNSPSTMKRNVDWDFIMKSIRLKRVVYIYYCQVNPAHFFLFDRIVS